MLSLLPEVVLALIFVGYALTGPVLAWRKPAEPDGTSPLGETASVPGAVPAAGGGLPLVLGSNGSSLAHGNGLAPPPSSGALPAPASPPAAPKGSA